ncbi:MAG: hypothetical protein GY851_26515 [bacterium]|nr:hypothetical protein [bacterium]
MEEWQATGQDQHSIIANPLFANAEACDFRLSPDSPAVKQLGFNPIDTSAIGLYGDPQWADAPKRIPREPSELPTVQDPEPVVDDFESTEVGDPPAGAHVSGETDKATIRVTDEVAATGSRCLKITDVAGLPQAFNPHMFYTPRFRQGMARASFDLRVEPGAIIYHEWRDGGHPYHVGPSIHVGGDGLLRANDQDVTTLPHGEWVHIEVACGLGRARTGTYSLTVTVPGKDPIRVDSINVGSDRFRRSDWAGFVADGNVDAVMYLDNLRIAVE